APQPTPGGGSVAAHAGALGAALVQMVAGLTAGKKKYASVDAEMRELAVRSAALGNTLASLVARDASAYAIVAAAYKLPGDSVDQQREKNASIDDALLHAADVPLETARACAEVADIAIAVAERGNANAISDAGVAALLAEAGCIGASYNVRINVNALGDRARGKELAVQVAKVVAECTAKSARVRQLVETSLAR
nr:cyclodeaminase/cyclohydrolase family protein [Gemmatimonadaceae bacterium]